MEFCIGCGAEAPMLAYTAVMADGSGGFKSEPVCYLCWRDPEHRKNPIKGHFFERRHAEAAVAAAERSKTTGNLG